MRLARSFEQGACIMAILATQQERRPVSSRTIERRLNMSMTYSQKLMRKLVVAGLVKAVSGNNGGFTLAKPINQISVLDTVVALNGDIESFQDTGLFGRVFKNPTTGSAELAINADSAVHRIFSMADNLWRQVLAQVTLQDVIVRVIDCSKLTPQLDWNSDAPAEELLQKISKEVKCFKA